MSANKLINIIKKSESSFQTILNTFSKISSISGDGKTLNAQNSIDGEIRDIKTLSPYGISSSGVDGIDVQVIVNDNDNNVAAGVFDKNKPPVKPGEIILYSKGGAKIKLSDIGDIEMSTKGGAKIKLLASGDIEMSTKGGAKIKLLASGDIKISVSGTSSINMKSAKDKIDLNGI